MSIFEYLMVLVSIIMGLGLTQALRGLSKIARSDTRCLPLTLWAGILVYLYVQAWWAFWDLNGVATWNQGYFTLLVLIPCIMFGATELLLPMGKTAETNWHAHFFKVRRWFFGMMFMFSSLATLQTFVLLGVPLAHPYRVIQVAILSLHVIGFTVASPRVHRWLPIFAIAIILAGQLLFRLVPGLAG